MCGRMPRKQSVSERRKVSPGIRQRSKAEAKGARRTVRRTSEYRKEAKIMFLDQPDIDFTLQEWEDCRNFYLKVSQAPGLPEDLAIACRKRARFAAENVRQISREIENLELLWALPEIEGK
jgi:hypothetical protein